jgi:hypothetical protein
VWIQISYWWRALRAPRRSRPNRPLGAAACVLVDDVAANLSPAADVGMATIHHTDSSATVKGALEEAFGLSLR